jgi:hypothetical protein
MGAAGPSLGLDPSVILPNMAETEFPSDDVMEAVMERVFSEWGSHRRRPWREQIIEASFQELAKHLPEELIIRAWYESHFFSQLSYAFRPSSIKWQREQFVPRLGVLQSLHLSLWQFSWDRDYERFMEDRRVLGSMDFSTVHPDLSSTLIFSDGQLGGRVDCDHREDWEAWGFSYRPWLDAHTAHLLWFRGRPVAIVALASLQSGIAVRQVQPLQQKGNRWLYKLPCSLLEAAVNVTMDAAAKENVPVWIVTGDSAGKRVRRYHQEEGPDEALVKRVEELYDQPIPRLMRTERFRSGGIAGETFRRLECVAA